MSALKYWMWFTLCHGLNESKKYELLHYFETPERIYFATAEEYRLSNLLSARQIEQLSDKSTERAEKVIEECATLGLHILTLRDADYPARLRETYNPPIVLYVKGALPVVDDEVCIAMVGTRNATPYGLRCAERIGYGLGKRGAVVVSGMAFGIDAASHYGALRAGGRVIAVLGSGADVIYPAENEELYHDIIASGAIVTEYPPGTKALGTHFPQRNRIISGLSLATVVVEAPPRSGALITANLALEQGREVFAVPGAIDSLTSIGCNQLIAEGAGLVMDSWDILRDYAQQYPQKIQEEPLELPQTLGYPAHSEAKRKQKGETKKREKKEQSEKEGLQEQAEEPAEELPVIDLRKGYAGLTDDQIDLLRLLKGGPRVTDELAEVTGIPMRRVLSAITMLEIDGYVTQDAGKQFFLHAKILEKES